MVSDSMSAVTKEIEKGQDRADANKATAESERKAEAKKQDEANRKPYDDYNAQLTAYKQDVAKAMKDLGLKQIVQKNTGATDHWEYKDNKGKIKQINDSQALALINARIASPNFGLRPESRGKKGRP